jgi:hypothetical protein
LAERAVITGVGRRALALSAALDGEIGGVLLG